MKSIQAGVSRRHFGAAMVMALALMGLTVADLRPAHAADDSRPEQQEAQAFVKSLADRAIGVLSQQEVERQKRIAVFRELLYEGFNLPFLARLALGRYRSKATPEQLAEYEELFSSFVLQKYSVMLGAYSGQTFDVVAARPAGKRDMYVETQVVSPDSSSIRVDWRVREYDGSMKIIDIVVENISMVISQREEFSAVIRREGFDGLLSRLRDAAASTAPTAG